MLSCLSRYSFVKGLQIGDESISKEAAVSCEVTDCIENSISFFSPYSAIFVHPCLSKPLSLSTGSFQLYFSRLPTCIWKKRFYSQIFRTRQDLTNTLKTPQVNRASQTHPQKAKSIEFCKILNRHKHIHTSAEFCKNLSRHKHIHTSAEFCKILSRHKHIDTSAEFCKNLSRHKHIYTEKKQEV